MFAETEELFLQQGYRSLDALSGKLNARFEKIIKPVEAIQEFNIEELK